VIYGGAVKPSITRGACPAYRPSQLAHEAVGPPFRCTGPYAVLVPEYASRQQDRGKCRLRPRALQAIELPELAELLVLEGLDIAITGTEKLPALPRRKRWLIRSGWRFESSQPRQACPYIHKAHLGG
jgi:hypothetical protein